jgi:hypothetical protein
VISILAVGIWVLGRAATILIFVLMMCDDVLCSPKTCFGEVVRLSRMLGVCEYGETNY